jgi:hypothetical protein
VGNDVQPTRGLAPSGVQHRTVTAERLTAGARPSVTRLDVVALRAARVVVMALLEDGVPRCYSHCVLSFLLTSGAACSHRHQSPQGFVSSFPAPSDRMADLLAPLPLKASLLRCRVQTAPVVFSPDGPGQPPWAVGFLANRAPAPLQRTATCCPSQAALRPRIAPRLRRFGSASASRSPFPRRGKEGSRPPGRTRPQGSEGRPGTGGPARRVLGHHAGERGRRHAL